MKISIITVCYNAQMYIEKTIQSVLDQTYPEIEYIIVDGASTDNTLAIVNKYKEKISKIISEKDDGMYYAMNKGIAESSGDILYFLNSDDQLYDHDVIQNVVTLFGENSNVEMVRGNIKFINIPDGEHVIVNDHRFAQLKTRRDLFTKLNFSHQGIFAKRSVFNKVGGFNLAYKLGADFDWFLRCYKAPIQIKYADIFIAFYNAQGLSQIKKMESLIERVKVVYKNSSLFEFFFYYLPYRSLAAIKYSLQNMIRKKG